MGLFTKSLLMLALAAALPFIYRNYAPESTKSTLSAYLSNYKSLDNLLKKGSKYVENFDLSETLEQAKQIWMSEATTKVSLVDCPTDKVDPSLKLFTKEQLAKYDGSEKSEGLLVAFLGSVYNVEKQKQHYGPEGDYAFFSGKDATRAFLTGNFVPDELTDNLDGVPKTSYDEIQNWLSFYDGEYEKVGRLVGTFYDESGCPTKDLKEVYKVLEVRAKEKNERKLEDSIFPECNSEWNSDQKKSRVWCSKMSGGVERDWVGVPRQLFNPETKSYRCACVRSVGPASNIDGQTDKIEQYNGDLNHPRVKSYENCDATSTECSLSLEV